jgi:hypothetical protein
MLFQKRVKKNTFRRTSPPVPRRGGCWRENPQMPHQILGRAPLLEAGPKHREFSVMMPERGARSVTQKPHSSMVLPACMSAGACRRGCSHRVRNLNNVALFRYSRPATPTPVSGNLWTRWRREVAWPPVQSAGTDVLHHSVIQYINSCEFIQTVPIRILSRLLSASFSRFLSGSSFPSGSRIPYVINFSAQSISSFILTVTGSRYREDIPGGAS